MNIQVTPVTPACIGAQAVPRVLPDFVIKAWNTCISRYWKGHGCATISSGEVIAEIVRASNGKLHEDEDVPVDWLDVRDIYHKAGWLIRRSGEKEGRAMAFHIYASRHRLPGVTRSC